MNRPVWAPLAKSVELVTAERRIAMRSERGAAIGKGKSTESLLSEGYRYSIDGGDPLPDPRSRWQPDGVHGASYSVGDAVGRATPLRRA